MKHALFILFLTGSAGLAALQPKPGHVPLTSPTQLLNAVDTAIKAKNQDTLLALVNWQGVSADQKSFQVEMLTDILTNAVRSVKLQPLPAGFEPTNELNGVRYAPNVAVVGLVEVQFAEEGNSLQLPYGRRDGAYLLAGTTEERIASPRTPAKSLNIIVVGSGSPDAAPFSGCCVYVTGGREVTNQISGKGNGSESFWGDYIKSCTVHKGSTNGGPIRLVVSENGRKVFQSKGVTTQAPIVYEKSLAASGTNTVAPAGGEAQRR